MERDTRACNGLARDRVKPICLKERERAVAGLNEQLSYALFSGRVFEPVKKR